MTRTCRNVLACFLTLGLAIPGTAIAAGGEEVWTSFKATTSVDAQGGKVVGAGLRFTPTGEIAVITAYRAGNGDELWEATIPASGDLPFIVLNQVVIRGNVVVAAGIMGASSDWMVAAFDARTGERLWLTTIPSDGFGGANSVTVVNNRVVAAGFQFEGGFDTPSRFITRGFDLNSGELEWQDIDPRAGSSFADKVAVVSGDESLVIAYGIVANPVNAQDKLIRAYNPEDGDIVWTQTIDSGRIEEGLDNFDVHEGVAYFAFTSFDSDPFVDGTWQVRAVDAWTGVPKWTMEMGPGFVDGLAVLGYQVAGTVNCAVGALESETGAVLWVNGSGDYCALKPVFARGHIVTAGFSWANFYQNVTAFKASDGEQKWTKDEIGVFNPAFFEFNTSDSIAQGRGMVFVGGIERLTAYIVR